MRGFILALGLALAMAVPASAQSGGVSGVVTDDSGGVLPGATVKVEGQGIERTVYADSEGRFSLGGLAAGSYRLKATLSGFETLERTVEVGGAVADLGTMQLEIAGLGETVVVSASRIESTLTNAPATMSVLTAATLEVSPAQNFGDVLRAVPGVNVTQTSARDIQLSSRKATGTLETSQLVLLDGRTIYLDFFGFVLWDLVPSNFDDIKQIEVVRGPASAVWGANALSGVVNILTKSPRETEGLALQFTGGLVNRDEGSRADDGTGNQYGVSGTWAAAPSESFSYRVSGGYFSSDPYSRPTGTVPVSTHPLDPSIQLGGAPYPSDTSGQIGAFENDGTKQPKGDIRFDHEFSDGSRLTWGGGAAGTQGIIHTGIGPFDIQSGSYMGYGRVAWQKDALRVAAFANWLDVEAPNLLLVDPGTLEPVLLNFKTQTFDLELGHSSVLGDNLILSYGGNARRNNFEITLTPNAEDRNELGGYLQAEYFVDRFRLTAGGRVDKFGNIEDPVFSPRLTAMFKPSQDHAFRVSYNQAFRSPSAVNNFLDQQIFAPQLIDLRQLAPFVPPPLQPVIGPFVDNPFPLVVNNVGNPDLKEEKVTAYEVSYTGTFKDRTTISLAWYQNTTDDNLNFASILPSADFPQGIPPFDVYTPTNPPPNLGPPAAAGALIAFLQAIPPPFGPIVLPRTVSTYLNLGPIRQRGVEVGIDHSFSRDLSGFVNYSWQDTPEVLEADADQIPYPTSEVGIPPENRFNVGLSYNGDRFLGSASVNYQDEALWVDVLTSTFHGTTDSFAMVNASVGMRFDDGRVTVSLKGTNLFNETIQQHVFGDILKRTVAAEVKLNFR